MPNEHKKLPIIAKIFPEIYKNVVVSLEQYTPTELKLNPACHAVLLKFAICQTEVLIGRPAKDVLGPLLTAKLERSNRYVPMVIMIPDSDASSLEKFDISLLNEAYVDVAIESVMRAFCQRSQIPFKRG